MSTTTAQATAQRIADWRRTLGRRPLTDVDIAHHHLLAGELATRVGRHEGGRAPGTLYGYPDGSALAVEPESREGAYVLGAWEDATTPRTPQSRLVTRIEWQG